MASPSVCYYFSLIIIAQFLLICVAEEKICPFEYIYQFGDSISDTGSIIRLGPIGAGTAAARLPYGETFFHRPTGRWSNGLLIIDFIAVALQIPIINTPLSAQLKWFRTLLNSTCPSLAECVRKLRRALVFVGEIGGNDFNYALSQGKSIQEVQTYVPDVVGVIINGVREVIRLGAMRVVVPGNFPIGCFPIFLTASPSANPGAYDDLGCLRNLNEFAVFQNNQLQRALVSLRQEFPQAVILYADYYSAFQSVLRRAPFLGFDKQSLLKACCGIGGTYNYDPNKMCGSQGVPVCSNPTQYIHWDGIHLTQETYRRISKILIGDILSRIQCVW